ncbi:hypothetical protein Lalb_Chr12g0206541 [Lupinus albus]|uniref:Uncharacterized protein n=1 Tax=Lupinus albus TaxID=3870 RepID=A0A6A4PNM0_LUPAL|nr:hypothetical protein Lalb_Chr12g0206541 [Lupinus albus]
MRLPLAGSSTPDVPAPLGVTIRPWSLASPACMTLGLRSSLGQYLLICPNSLQWKHPFPFPGHVLP